MTGPVTVYAGGSHGEERHRVTERQHLNLFLKDQVCRRCNNEWLGRLEKAAKPILGPMIVEARATDLDAAAQDILATWATKMAFHIELALRQNYPDAREVEGYEPSEVERAWLFANNEPPPRTRVWLGAFDAKHTIPLRHETFHMLSKWKNVPAHVTTFTVGFVCFQVFTLDFVAADAAEVAPVSDPPPSLASALTQIWPMRTAEVSWPTVRFDARQWDDVCTWDGHLRAGAPIGTGPGGEPTEHALPRPGHEQP